MNRKYYSTIDSLKPSRKAVDAAVANALRLEKSGKVIEMKPANNKKKLTAIGTIAASLALIIALGAVFFPHGNSLVLKVNAAELSDKSFSAIAKLNRDGGSHMITDEGAERKSEIITNDFAFDLDCVGDNIKSYTCEVKNGSFVIGDTTALADAVPAEKTYKAPFEKEYASFTAEAEAKIPEIRLITGIDLLDENLPKAVLRITGLDESKYYDDGYGKDNIEADLNEELKLAFEGLSVRITVCYNDGSKTEKTLVFTPEAKVTRFEKDIDEDGSFGYDYDTETVVKAKTA